MPYQIVALTLVLIHCQVLTSIDEARDAAILREGHAKAKYTFTAQSPMEMSFRKVRILDHRNLIGINEN